jgi:hypothetical protein
MARLTAMSTGVCAVAYMGMTWKAGAPHDRLLPSGRADAVGPHVSPPQRSKLMLFRKTAGKSQRASPCITHGFLLLVSLVASAALTAVEHFFDTFMTQWAVILPLVELTLSFAMTTLLFAMIYKYIPRERLA